MDYSRFRLELLKIGKFEIPCLLPEELSLFEQEEEMYVYLAHLHQPMIRSNGVKVSHYVGSTMDLERRFWQHEHGQNGSKLLKEANRRGLIWTYPIIWKAGREFEQKLKREKHLARWCPLCSLKMSDTRKT